MLAQHSLHSPHNLWEEQILQQFIFFAIFLSHLFFQRSLAFPWSPRGEWTKRICLETTLTVLTGCLSVSLSEESRRYRILQRMCAFNACWESTDRSLSDQPIAQRKKNDPGFPSLPDILSRAEKGEKRIWAFNSIHVMFCSWCTYILRFRFHSHGYQWYWSGLVKESQSFSSVLCSAATLTVQLCLCPCFA